MVDRLGGYVQAVLGFFAGTNDWIQRRWWLRGGVHHAGLVALVMAAGGVVAWMRGGVPASGTLQPALVMLGWYASEWASEGSTDSFTDFATPAGFVALVYMTDPFAAVLALVLYGGARFVYGRTLR